MVKCLGHITLDSLLLVLLTLLCVGCGDDDKGNQVVDDDFSSSSSCDADDVLSSSSSSLTTDDQSYISTGYSLMRYKMEVLWKYYDVANIVALGSSRVLDGVVPNLFSDEFNVLNLAQTPEFSIFTPKYFLEHYVFPHVKRLKYVVISLDFDLWKYGEKSYKNFFYKSYANLPGYVYDKNHNYWVDGVPDGLAEATEEGYAETYQNMVIGNKGNWSDGVCRGCGFLDYRTQAYSGGESSLCVDG